MYENCNNNKCMAPTVSVSECVFICALHVHVSCGCAQWFSETPRITRAEIGGREAD